jgi:hypothetical protein
MDGREFEIKVTGERDFGNGAQRFSESISKNTIFN